MDLFEARARKRLTQWDIRKATGIHQSKVSLIERGYIQPTEEEKKLLAEVLGLPVDHIFQRGKEAVNNG